MQARDPTLILTITCHKHFPGHVHTDPRLAILEQVDRFAEWYGLQPAGTRWQYSRATDINLVELHRSPPAYQRLVNLRRESPGSDTSKRTLYQCLIYAYHDALIVQLLIGKYSDWSGTVLSGWQVLTEFLRAGFDGNVLQQARHGAFGASVVYWAIADDEQQPNDYADEVAAVLQTQSPRLTETDIGLLWENEIPLLTEAADVFQDCWVLITPRSAEAEANRRYNLPLRDSPPDFVVVALARHKFAFERSLYLDARGNLERIEARLDDRARWILDTQLYHGAELSDLRSKASDEFQAKLVRASNDLADYTQTTSRVEELQRTVAVNRKNFLINCTALISREGAAQVELAERQSDAASAFLATWSAGHREEIFRGELGQMQGLCDQLDTAIHYSHRLSERYATAFRSGREQLQIAGERQIAEISAGGSVDTALVVASLALVVAVQLLQISGWFERQPWFAANVMLLVLSGTFLVSLALTGSPLNSRLRRGAFAATIGLLASSAAALFLDIGSPWFIWMNLGVFVVGALMGILIHGWFEIRSRLRRRERSQRASESRRRLDKLAYAAEALPDFVQDLPPPTTYRIKDESSLLEKIARKNAREAATRGITIQELHARGEDYKITNIGDAIGVRYVVPPWEMADVIARILAVTHVIDPEHPVDYKSTTTRLGFKTQLVDDKLVEVIDPDYHGKYRAAHIDVDVWGVGARKDVNLLAEIQVRTPLQDLSASWFHDILYKENAPEQDSAPRLLRFFDRRLPWMNRVIARGLMWLGDGEAWVFGGVIGWNGHASSPTPRSTKDAFK